MALGKPTYLKWIVYGVYARLKGFCVSDKVKGDDGTGKEIGTPTGKWAQTFL